MAVKDQHKRQAAEAALNFITPGVCLGVGSGSTVHYFIQSLFSVKQKIDVVVASSQATAKSLEAAGFRCANDVAELDLYVDGADEVDDNRQLIKGGGGAHAREKVLACSAKKFVCIVDGEKHVGRLGKFPLPVEVLPMARGFAARRLAAAGGSPKWRESFVTDNGNWILDVALLDLTDAVKMETEINAIAGVLDNGLFARRKADVVLIADNNGVRRE